MESNAAKKTAKNDNFNIGPRGTEIFSPSRGGLFLFTVKENRVKNTFSHTICAFAATSKGTKNKEW